MTIHFCHKERTNSLEIIALSIHLVKILQEKSLLQEEIEALILHQAEVLSLNEEMNHNQANQDEVLILHQAEAKNRTEVSTLSQAEVSQVILLQAEVKVLLLHVLQEVALEEEEESNQNSIET